MQLTVVLRDVLARTGLPRPMVRIVSLLVNLLILIHPPFGAN
jgi:hypothetical protein